jgi:hypothetical protein
VEKYRLFARATPRNVVRSLPFQKVGQFRWFFPFVEKLVQGDFQSPSQFFQRLDRWNRVAILDARNIAAQQPGPLLDVSLGEFLSLP